MLFGLTLSLTFLAASTSPPFADWSSTAVRAVKGRRGLAGDERRRQRDERGFTVEFVLERASLTIARLCVAGTAPNFGQRP